MSHEPQEEYPQKHALAPCLASGTKLSFRLEAHESLSTESRQKVSLGYILLRLILINKKDRKHLLSVDITDGDA